MQERPPETALGGNDSDISSLMDVNYRSQGGLMGESNRSGGEDGERKSGVPESDKAVLTLALTMFVCLAFAQTRVGKKRKCFN